MISFEQRVGPLREGTTFSYARNFSTSSSGSASLASNSFTSTYAETRTSNTSFTRFSYSYSSASSSWLGGANTTTTSGSFSSTFESTFGGTFTVATHTTTFLQDDNEGRTATSTRTRFTTRFTTTSHSGTASVSTTTTQPFSPPFTTTTSSSSSSVIFTTQSTSTSDYTTTLSTRTPNLFTMTTAVVTDSFGIRDTHYFYYAEPSEVLWILPVAADFSARAVLTDVASTTTSFSFSRATNQTTQLQEVPSAAVATIPSESFITSTSQSYIRTTTGIEATTVYPFLNRMPPSVTTTSTGGRVFTTISSTYLVSSFSFSQSSRTVRSSTEQTQVQTLISRDRQRIISRGLAIDELFTRTISTSRLLAGAAPYTKSAETDTDVTTGGNIYKIPYDYGTSFIYKEGSNSGGAWAATSVMTGWLDGMTTVAGGWLTGLTVPVSAASLATNILVARSFQRSYVGFPGSFQHYTLLKNSITYTRSTQATGAETGTVLTTESAELGLSGSTNRANDASFVQSNLTGGGSSSSVRLGGRCKINETHYANLNGPGKLNNATTTMFAADLSSTGADNQSASASMARLLFTLAPETAAAPFFVPVIAVPRHIFTLV